MIVTKVSRPEEPKSYPIEIKFLIESKQELQILWHKLNIAMISLRKTAPTNKVDLPGTGSLTYPSWDIVDELARGLGIRKDLAPRKQQEVHDDDACLYSECKIVRNNKHYVKSLNENKSNHEILFDIERVVNELAKKIREERNERS